MTNPIDHSTGAITTRATRPETTAAGQRDAAAEPGAHRTSGADDAVTLSSAGQQLGSVESAPGGRVDSTQSALDLVNQITRLIGTDPTQALNAQATGAVQRLGGLLSASA